MLYIFIKIFITRLNGFNLLIIQFYDFFFNKFYSILFCNWLKGLQFGYHASGILQHFLIRIINHLIPFLLVFAAYIFQFSIRGFWFVWVQKNKEDTLFVVRVTML